MGYYPGEQLLGETAMKGNRTRLYFALILLGVIWSVAGAHEAILQYRAKALPPATVGFAWRPLDADAPDYLLYDDAQVRDMVDEVISQTLGPEGLAALVSPGDKVVIKPNIVEPFAGATGEKGRAVITDARIVRYVAEKVRAIIGDEPPAELLVVDTTLNQGKNGPDDPSAPGYTNSFHWCKVERTGNDAVDAGDYCYDRDSDGILDGTSNAVLVNLDAVHADDRFPTEVSEPHLGTFTIYMPKFLRTREQAVAAGEPDTYCDVFIGLPILKSHQTVGFTGALKLHYGFRAWENIGQARGRNGWYHSGTISSPPNVINGFCLDEYICAMHKIRSYDFILMDCLTGNRQGPNVCANRTVDYIFTNALLASVDPVAIDTVGTLLAGYDQATVELLEAARRDQLGTDNPAEIEICGLTAFMNHRTDLLADYGPSEKYPFEDNWGRARVMKDFSPPTHVSVSPPNLPIPTIIKPPVSQLVHLGKQCELSITAEPSFLFSFPYQAYEDRTTDLGLSRIELIIDDKPFFSVKAVADKSIAADLESLEPGEHGYRVVAWDKAFNCSVSAELQFNFNDSRTLTYKWKRNGVEIPGAAEPILDIPSVTRNDLGEYTCEITGAYGSTETKPVSVDLENQLKVSTIPLIVACLILFLVLLWRWWTV